MYLIEMQKIMREDAIYMRFFIQFVIEKYKKFQYKNGLIEYLWGIETPISSISNWFLIVVDRIPMRNWNKTREGENGGIENCW